MRYGYAFQHPCPKDCGSTNMVLFSYCCSLESDLVCQDCGAAEVIHAYLDKEHNIHNPIIDAAWKGESVSRDIGFVGKKDMREKFHELFPTVVSDPKAN